MAITSTINPFTGDLQLLNDGVALTFKDAVATAASLPTLGNSTNDARFTTDTGHLYIWNGSSWVDQGNIIDFTWDSLTGKPISSPSAIDAAVAATIKLEGDVTYYVALDGNDDTGDGSTGNPFATLQHAIDLVPKDLNGHFVQIYIKSGDYSSAGGVLAGKLFSFYDSTFATFTSYIEIDSETGIPADVVMGGGDQLQILGNQIQIYFGGWTIGSNIGIGDNTAFIDVYDLKGSNTIGINNSSVRFSNLDSPTLFASLGGIVYDRNPVNTTHQISGGIFIDTDAFLLTPESAPTTAYEVANKKYVDDGLLTKQDALGFTPVPDTRTINSQPLSSDVTLTKSDVGLSNVPNLDTTSAVSDAHSQNTDTILQGFDPSYVLVAHFDGAGGSPVSSTSDSSVSAHTLSSLGVTLDDSSPKFGATEAQFIGNQVGNSVTVNGTRTDWDFDVLNFTIEAFIKITGTLPSISILFSAISSGTGWQVFINDSDGTLNVFSNSFGVVTSTAPWSPVLNTRYHVVIQRNGSNIQFFIDGVQLGANLSIGATAFTNPTTELVIGEDDFGAARATPMNMDELIINKGNALYSGTFTPRTSAFTFSLADFINMGTLKTNMSVDPGIKIDGRDISVDGVSLDAHEANVSNPHSVTASQVGLGSVTNDAQLKASDLDTDGTFAANSDTKVASQKATKTYADQLIGAANAVVYKGVQDCSANPNYPTADAGWLYIVSVAGKIGGASGVTVEVGDLFICNTDGTSSGNQATVGAFWNVIEKNDTGVVSGPASSTDTDLVSFNGTTGKIVQDSGLTTANTSSAISLKHTQNTDTGTSQTTFQIDNGNSGPKVKNSSGKVQLRNAADSAYAGLDTLNVGDGSNNTPVTNLLLSGINIIIDGGGSVLTTGVKGDVIVPFDCTIIEADLLADQSGSVVVDIFKCTQAQYDAGSTHPVSGDKITSSTPPTITTSTKSADTTLSSWTVSLSKGDVLRFNVNSVTTITRVSVFLEVRKR